MRVGFIGDPLVIVRRGVEHRHPPLALLDGPYAWRGSAPDAGRDLYAGVVELDAIQVQALLDRATAAGIRLALVLDIDKANGSTQPLSLQENVRITSWMLEKGLPAPGPLEGQIDYVQRLQRLLNDAQTMDLVLADVEREVDVMSRQAVVVGS